MTIKLFKIEIVPWVNNTVAKADKDIKWRDAWIETYFELGGKSQSSSEKACPLNGTKTLYKFGRIKGQLRKPVATTLEQVINTSKNGLYAFLAFEALEKEPKLPHKVLWQKVQTRVRGMTGSVPVNDEGTVKIVLALWNMGLIQHP